MSHIATRSFNLHWTVTILRLVTLVGGLTVAELATPVAAQDYQPLKAPTTQINIEVFNRGAIADLQKAARIFSNQGNSGGYQQTLDLIQMIQQLPTPKSLTFPVYPETV